MLPRIWNVLTFGTLLGALPAAAQPCPNPALLVGGYAQPHAAVRYLADDALEGRRAGSAGERCAAEYIAAEFRRLRFAPLGEDGGYFQQVPVSGPDNPHGLSAVGRNVVALLPGWSPVLRDEVVVIGAHYDHLGLGGPGSLAPEAHGEVHNGADDNASGVAAMLVAAERLSRDPPARSVVFIAFTGEELGLLGSARYAAQPAIPLERTRAMLNLDMVGRLETEPLIVYGVGTAREWEAILQRANNAGLPLALRPEGYGPSDHTSFYARDVPVLHFFTNTHEDYHRPSDEWHRVDYDGITRIARLVERVARDVAGRAEPLVLVRSATPPSAERGAGSAAYLGSIPDYTPDEHGLRISGVRGGSPAEYAGLRAGDVIVSLDDQRISDIQDLTAALRAHQPGDRVRLSIIRGGAELVLYADLTGRPSPGN